MDFNVWNALVAALCLALTPIGAQAKKTAKQEPADVQCKDGTTSKAGRGACSHHGGIGGMAPADEARNRKAARTGQESQAPQSPAPQARTPANSPQRTPPAGQPTARCKDGSLSYSQHRSGTCSRHGGVAEWLAR
jgi:hypothetical protein